MKRTRPAQLAAFTECVTMRIVCPPRFTSPKRRSSSSVDLLSSAPVGSSASRMRGLCDERAGNGGALLLAAGDLVGVLFQKLADAERFRNIDEAGAHLIVALAREDEREIDVILERERVEQVELLKHEPEIDRGGTWRPRFRGSW